MVPALPLGTATPPGLESLHAPPSDDNAAVDDRGGGCGYRPGTAPTLRTPSAGTRDGEVYRSKEREQRLALAVPQYHAYLATLNPESAQSILRRPRITSHPSQTCRASTEGTTNDNVTTSGDRSDAYRAQHPGVAPLAPCALSPTFPSMRSDSDGAVHRHPTLDSRRCAPDPDHGNSRSNHLQH
jgi:hypothetical protein